MRSGEDERSGAPLRIERPNGAARFERDALVVDQLGREGRFPYREVERLRLTYRPKSLEFHVFQLDLRLRDGRTLKLSNVARMPGSLFQPYRRWDAGYRTLVGELTRRVARAAPQARLEAGFPFWRWALAALVGVGSTLFVFAAFVDALFKGDGKAIAVTAAGFGLMSAFLAPFLFRNLPRPLPGGDPPPQVLPRP